MSTVSVGSSSVSAESSRRTLEDCRAQDALRLRRRLTQMMANVALNAVWLGSGASALLAVAFSTEGSVAGRAAFILTYLAVNSLVLLPLDWFDYRAEHRAGVLHLRGRAWFGKWLRELPVGWAIQGAVFLGLTLVLKHAPQLWFPAAALLITVLMGVLVALSPVLARQRVKMEPLTDQAVLEVTADVFGQAGVNLHSVQVARVSEFSHASNAFVQPSARGAQLVLADTLLGRASEAELRFVLAHEVGHFVRRDLWKLMGWQWVQLLLVLSAAAFVTHWAQVTWGWEPGSAASLPLLAVSFTVCFQVLSVAGNAVKRHLEYGADAYAVKLTRDLQAMQSVLAGLAHDNASDPNPSRAVELLFHDHPAQERRFKAAAEAMAVRHA